MSTPSTPPEPPRRPASADPAEDLAIVCDAYGLPYDVLGLVRHLSGNADLTIHNWKVVAATQRSRAEARAETLAQVRAELTRRRDALPERRTPEAHGAIEVIAAVEKILDDAPPPASILDTMDAMEAE